MRAKIELSNITDVKKFTEAVNTVDCDVRLTNREHTAHEVDWNTIWCVCEQDIYSTIRDFVVP